MPLRPSDSVINSHKKAIDLASNISRDAKFFIESLDPQQKNQFKILISADTPPANITFADRAIQAAKSTLDSKVFDFFIQNIDIPVNSIEYFRLDDMQGVQDVTYADEVSMTFIEDELSIVRTFLQNWMELTFKRNITKGGYTFNDNQYLARKKAIILPMSRGGIPNTVWIEIRGMRFKSMDNFAFDQQSSDPMMIPVTFAVDGVYLNSLL